MHLGRYHALLERASKNDDVSCSSCLMRKSHELFFFTSNYIGRLEAVDGGILWDPWPLHFLGILVSGFVVEKMPARMGECDGRSWEATP